MIIRRGVRKGDKGREGDIVKREGVKKEKSRERDVVKRYWGGLMHGATEDCEGEERGH